MLINYHWYIGWEEVACHKHAFEKHGIVFIDGEELLWREAPGVYHTTLFCFPCLQSQSLAKDMLPCFVTYFVLLYILDNGFTIGGLSNFYDDSITLTMLLYKGLQSYDLSCQGLRRIIWWLRYKSTGFILQVRKIFVLIVSSKRFVPDSLYTAVQTSTILTLENVTFVQNQIFWQM